jgi:flagellin-like hook-associated protein FlgL
MTSIGLSAGVRSSLLALNSITSQLATVQERIATGLRVNSPTDDPVAYFAAAGLNQQASQLNGLTNGFNTATGAIGAANNGISAIQSLVSAAQTLSNQALASTPSSVVSITGTRAGLATNTQIANGGGDGTHFKPGDTVTVNDGTTTATYTAANNDTVQTFLNAINGTANIKVTASLNASGYIVLTANSPNVNVTIGGTVNGAGGGSLSSILGLTAGTTNYVVNTTRQSLAAQYNNLLTEINTAAQDAGFNGVNLLTGSTFSLNLDAAGNTLSVTGGTTTATGLGLAQATNQWQGNSDINTALTNISNSLTSLQTLSTSLSTENTIGQAWQTFNKNLASTFQTGATALTAADTNADGALAAALTTQQQLAASALSITSNNSTGALRLLAAL